MNTIGSKERISDPIAWTAGYVFWSFYFSQGNGAVQKNIDEWAVHRFPEIKENVRAYQSSIESEVTKRISRFFNPKNTYPHTDKATENPYSEASYRLGVIMTCSAQNPPTTMQLATAMLDRDEKYLRPITSDTTYGNVMYGPMQKSASRTQPEHPRFGKSLILTYLYDDVDAPHDVFRQFFTELKELPSYTPEFTLLLHTVNEYESRLKDMQPRILGRLATGE